MRRHGEVYEENDEEWLDDWINGVTWHRPDTYPSEDSETENWLKNK